MKRLAPLKVARWAGLLALAAGTQAYAAEDSSPVRLPAYEITAPPFTSPMQEFYVRGDNLFNAPWVDAGRGGALIEAILWRHAYLSEHPSDRAVILLSAKTGGKDKGEVKAATVIYTDGGGLFANSYALGDRIRLRGLAAADIDNTARVRRAVESVRRTYLLHAQSYAQDRTPFFPGAVGWYPNNILADYTVMGEGEGFGSVPTIAPYTLYRNPNGGLSTRDFGGEPVYFYSTPAFLAYSSDRLHPPEETLEAVYHALSDPGQAGIVPVGLSRIPLPPPGGGGLRSTDVLAFDWDGVHYLYRPLSGTFGIPIPRNPVTGEAYLCVRDAGLLESVYFCATYLQQHPKERAVLVPGEIPAAAYTAPGGLCLFCPGLNQFAQLRRTPAADIDRPEVLARAVGRMQAVLAQVARRPGSRSSRDRIPRELAGDTADEQMRRAYLALAQAGLSPHLKSAPGASTLTFSWRGADYRYGPDERVTRLN